jgi:bisphosphoglycerate-independent phosphoglycerate mutase (AlkP superfamily)
MVISGHQAMLTYDHIEIGRILQQFFWRIKAACRAGDFLRNAVIKKYVNVSASLQ